jgi:hypothetical protein
MPPQCPLRRALSFLAKDSFFARRQIYCTKIQLLAILHPWRQRAALSVIDFDMGADMKHIQAWFERIAGISRDEMARLTRAREIFAASDTDLASLQLPACWRRSARVQVRVG